MKGKKPDNEFISEFIIQACLSGNTNITSILSKAEEEIQEIDKKLLELLTLKSRRIKLSGLLDKFKKNNALDIEKLNVLLNFYRIKNKKNAKEIINKILGYSVVDDVCAYFSQKEQILCIKQLLEFKIICRSGDKIIAGDNFPSFVNFLKDHYF